MKLFINVSLLLILMSCASESEKEERRQNAFDLTGTYTTSLKTGSEVNMTMDIHNESGRHDIYVNLERSSVLTENENKLLKKHDIPSYQVERFLLPKMTLGKNSDRNARVIHLDGGENISDDFGESSRFSVCSPSFEVTGKSIENATNVQYHAYYCLKGTVKKTNFQLSGELKLYISLQYDQIKNVTEQDSTTTEESVTTHIHDSTSLKYKSDASSIFYNQLQGQWSGVINGAPSFDSELKGAFNTFNIVFESENQFYLSPSKKKTISVDGVVYKYEKVLSDMMLLKNATVPLVEMHFVNKNTETRVILVGQIFSLGNLTGSIILYNKSEPEGIQIASFEHKKD